MIAYARIAALRCLRSLRGRGAVACAIVLPTAVAGIVHAPPPFGASGEPAAVVLASSVAAALTSCLGAALLAASVVRDESERGRARALRAAGLDVTAMIAAQSIFVVGAATILSLLAFLGPILLSLASIPVSTWRHAMEGVLAAALVSGLFGLGLPLVVPRWAAFGASTCVALLASASGAGLDDWTRGEAARAWAGSLGAAVMILVMGGLLGSRRLDEGSA